MIRQFYFKTIQFSISSTHLKCQTVPFDPLISGATTLGQGGPGSDGNKGVLRIPQSSNITEALSSDAV